MTQPSLKCQEQKAKRKFHQPICTFAYLIRVSLFAAREKKIVLTAVFSLPCRPSSTHTDGRGHRPIQFLMCFRSNAF